MSHIRYNHKACHTPEFVAYIACLQHTIDTEGEKFRPLFDLLKWTNHYRVLRLTCSKTQFKSIIHERNCTFLTYLDEIDLN